MASFFFQVGVLIFLFFLFLLGKRGRLVFFLLGLEVLLLGLLFFFLITVNFFMFFIMGILGVVSSIGCLILFLKIVVSLGNDLVFF
jgi:hypothetical protein